MYKPYIESHSLLLQHHHVHTYRIYLCLQVTNSISSPQQLVSRLIHCFPYYLALSMIEGNVYVYGSSFLLCSYNEELKKIHTERKRKAEDRMNE